MAERHVRIWYDAEGDYLEVLFDDRPGHFRETANDAVMQRVNEEGNVIAFSILGVSAAQPRPLEIELAG